MPSPGVRTQEEVARNDGQVIGLRQDPGAFDNFGFINSKTLEGGRREEGGGG